VDDIIDLHAQTLVTLNTVSSFSDRWIYDAAVPQAVYQELGMVKIQDDVATRPT
jgi:hypothetical protein